MTQEFPWSLQKYDERSTMLN